MASNNPNTRNNQITSTMTTTALRILLILLSIGIYELMSQRNTPTMINTSKMVTKGITFVLELVSCKGACRWQI
jgi:hypothetical protein